MAQQPGTTGFNIRKSTKAAQQNVLINVSKGGTSAKTTKKALTTRFNTKPYTVINLSYRLLADNIGDLTNYVNKFGLPSTVLSSLITKDNYAVALASEFNQIRAPSKPKGPPKIHNFDVFNVTGPYTLAYLAANLESAQVRDKVAAPGKAVSPKKGRKGPSKTILARYLALAPGKVLDVNKYDSSTKAGVKTVNLPPSGRFAKNIYIPGFNIVAAPDKIANVRTIVAEMGPNYNNYLAQFEAAIANPLSLSTINTLRR